MAEVNRGGPLVGSDLLDDRMRALDRHCWSVSGEFRKLGELLDQDPDAIDDHLDLPGVLLYRFFSIPRRYWPALDVPPQVAAVCGTSLAQAVVWERFSYADPNVLLAGPGPALSSDAIHALADEEQTDRWFRRFAARPDHTFFAVTEPAKGSAATELTTTLRPATDGDGWVLNGEKTYVGNGARGQVGLVFCRRAPGPWGIEAVLVEASSPGFSAELLPSVGLRGARISRMRFEDVRIPARNLLGQHRRPTQRGLHGARQVFYRARPGIAAMAVGCAQAVCDHVRGQGVRDGGAGGDRLAAVEDRIAAIRRLIHRIAADIDGGLIDPHRIAAAKAGAARVAEDATVLAAELLGPASLLDDPWLEKVYRDVRAFEFMEGAGNVHLLSVFQGLLKGSGAGAVEPEGVR
ncbi:MULTISPECIES: acyl-CoA dehydrogenase family protein [unclassified Micromonospora]|uniref:acyl-CoA dehydrogenase family protein n=1 Tax=unclassified Micromonospora TaxID=2617518 RepID=UPI001033894F|nr:acyl-CoA dehydrogenase family protein [Verrucosispora sp. SN26_14.1]TBL44489.1 acyl-CoA dehydrogenase [Verrucosispora sp. SN26_14.1]